MYAEPELVFILQQISTLNGYHAALQDHLKDCTTKMQPEDGHNVSISLSLCIAPPGIYAVMHVVISDRVSHSLTSNSATIG